MGGVINLFTALLHTFGGELSLVVPLMDSSLQLQTKTEWLGVWHMITVLLFATSYVLLVNGWRPKSLEQTILIKYIGYLFLLFGMVFILVSLYKQTLAPQWILFIPMGWIFILGARQQAETTNMNI